MNSWDLPEKMAIEVVPSVRETEVSWEGRRGLLFVSGAGRSTLRRYNGWSDVSAGLGQW